MYRLTKQPPATSCCQCQCQSVRSLRSSRSLPPVRSISSCASRRPCLLRLALASPRPHPRPHPPSLAPATAGSCGARYVPRYCENLQGWHPGEREVPARGARGYHVPGYVPAGARRIDKQIGWYKQHSSPGTGTWPGIRIKATWPH